MARIQGWSTDDIIIESTLRNEIADDHNDADLLESIDENDSDISKWMTQIDSKAKDLVERLDGGDRDNILENHAFAQQFIRLCKMFSIWSASSCKFFNSNNPVGSSWSSETNFKNVKQLHAGKIPCSFDEFLTRDMQLTNSGIILASQKYMATPNFSSAEEIAKENSKCVTEEKSPDSDQTNQPIESLNSEIPTSIIESSSNQGKCLACERGDLPTGSHKCVSCHKSVHLLPFCSISIGDDEGCGELRKCYACSQQPDSKTIELNYEEKWSSKKKKG